VDTGTKLAVRKGIASVADQINPLFPLARQTFANAKSLENMVADTSVANRPTPIGAAGMARTEAGPEIAYGMARNPLFVMSSMANLFGKKSLVNKLSDALASGDPAALRALAEEKPFREAFKMFGAGLLAPFKQGEFPYPDQSQPGLLSASQQ
jgi:hypothetical protein